MGLTLLSMNSRLDCLRSFTDLEELDETELYMCHKCKKKQKSTKKFWIQKLPKVSEGQGVGGRQGIWILTAPLLSVLDVSQSLKNIFFLTVWTSPCFLTSGVKPSVFILQNCELQYSTVFAFVVKSGSGIISPEEPCWSQKTGYAFTKC